MNVAVLFARSDSIYKTMEGLDVWDRDRNALNYRGALPVVAHPPCRAWGSLRGMAKPEAGEMELALWAVLQVRLWGGVLEHPRGSILWPVAHLPEPGERDAWGGFTVIVPQMWWGHRAEKATRLYVCGVEPSDLPDVPMKLGEAERCITNRNGVRKGHPKFKTEVTHFEREATPPAFATWLVELASRCRR